MEKKSERMEIVESSLSMRPDGRSSLLLVGVAVLCVGMIGYLQRSEIVLYQLSSNNHVSCNDVLPESLRIVHSILLMLDGRSNLWPSETPTASCRACWVSWKARRFVADDLPWSSLNVCSNHVSLLMPLQL
eukprot:750583-Hanusia_phi.AAC.4